MAGYYVSSLKHNDVSANLRSGTFALKWPEEANKPPVRNILIESNFFRITYRFQLLLIYPLIPKDFI